MSNKTKVGELRESFLKLRGGKLISVEAFILALIVLYVLNVVKNVPIGTSLIVAAIVGFVFPILIGVFKSLAWLAAVLFSLIWALLAFVIAGAIADGSYFVGFIFGLIFFVISFFVHKNYSGLSFQGISLKNNKHIDSTTLYEPSLEGVRFCPKCGRRIISTDGRCNVCDK